MSAEEVLGVASGVCGNMGTNPGGAAAGGEETGVGFVRGIAGDRAARVIEEYKRESFSDSKKIKRDWFFIIIVL